MLRRIHMTAERMSIIATALVGVLLVVPLGCDNSSGGKSNSGGGSSNKAPAASDSDDGDTSEPAGDQPMFGEGKISGRITVKGAKPNNQKLAMTGDQYCTTFDKQFVPPKNQIGEDGGLPHTFVYIKKGIRNKYSVPEDAAVLDQSKCMYDPHIMGIQVGQTLKITNSDNTAHNVHAQPKRNEKFNVAQPRAGVVTEKEFRRPEIMVKFKCDVHGWMSAYVGVVKHPFFAVTDENGNFEIEKLPPGTYTLATWHELYGEREAEVTIADDSAETFDIEYARKE